MSLDIFVIATTAALPSAGEWAEAIKREGLNIDLDQSFDTQESSGFRPCPGSDRGFEYSVGPLSDADIKDFDFSPEQKERVKTLDLIVGFHYKTDADFEVVRGASAVLAKLTQGMVVETESGAVMTPMQALAWARGEFEPESSSPNYSLPQEHDWSLITIAKFVVLILIVGYWLFRWATG
jgi:hypothetical protein